MNYEEEFRLEEENLQADLDYKAEGFFLDVVENIGVAMREAGIQSRADLAKLLGVSPARVTSLLRGYKKNPGLRTIVQYAHVLGVDPHDLCARRKTTEAFERPLSLVRGGYESATVLPKGKANGRSDQAA